MKRGSSGLSLIVGVNKPVGMSSHDVVNRARRIFGERRCGHTGTLDPLASGVLPICIGPATRLDQFMTEHDKRYRVSIGFGFETTTDDAAGQRTVEGSVPSYLYDEQFARERVASLVRTHTQVPPQYSAIKVAGKKAYEVARAGGEIALEPRVIEVYEAELVEIRADWESAWVSSSDNGGSQDESEGRNRAPDGSQAEGAARSQGAIAGEAGETGGPALVWVVDLLVSKGTYIRSLAHDLGREVLCPAHVAALERRSAGSVGIEHCVSLESLEALGMQAALDPVAVLGLRYAFADDFGRYVQSGAKLFPNQVVLHEPLSLDDTFAPCVCTSGVVESLDPPVDGELACIIVANRLKALYRFDAAGRIWKPACVFSVGIYRG